MPTVRFLKKLKSRDEERKKKNVDYKLEKLKEEIRAERLEKKIAKLKGNSSGEGVLSKQSKKKRSRDKSGSDDDESKNDDGLLVVKQVHEWDIEEDMVHVDKSGPTAVKPGGEELASAKEEYLQRVRDRLTKTRDLDRKEERERIHEKHKKKRMKDKVDTKKPEDGNDEMLVTLGGASDDETHDDVESENEEESVYEDSDNDSMDDNSNASVDVKAHEELALAMLGS
eukprot:CCRYP_012827-RB/>CCRYP_012827-RB protein AED:0.43 eAED:0.43 QI:0/0/0/1/0/0/2/0/226